MTVMTPDPVLSGAVLRHLDAQLASARRLLDLILRQGQAIRERDVEGVLLRLSDVKTEMAMRERLEHERSALIDRAAAALGVAPAGVTLDALTGLMPDAEVPAARERSAELRGLLSEIAREHGINRALMRQELAFLDHLVRLIGQDTPGGHRVLDLSV